MLQLVMIGDCLRLVAEPSSVLRDERCLRLSSEGLREGESLRLRCFFSRFSSCESLRDDRRRSTSERDLDLVCVGMLLCEIVKFNFN